MSKPSLPAAGFLGAGGVIAVLMVLGSLTPDTEPTGPSPSLIQGDGAKVLYCKVLDE